jgi:hypothetical protein
MVNTQKLGVVSKNSSAKGDVFTFRDGNFVGHDGFIVPNNFSEFYLRFPTYVADWVRRCVRGCNRRFLHFFATNSRGIEFPR